MGIQLTEKEQELLVLCIVKECIVYAEKNNKTFEDVLNEDLFPAEANTGFAEMVCKTIEALKNKGCIDGTVELEYEIKIDPDTFEEESTDAIDFSSCTFDDIRISEKGNKLLSAKELKGVNKDFGKKVKAVIKCIGTTALQTCVESAVILLLRTAGIQI